MNITSYKTNCWVLFISGLTLLASCSNNKHEVDLTGVEVELDLARFDKDLLACQEGDFDKCKEELHKNYNEFYESYIIDILGFRRTADKSPEQMLQSFLANEDMHQLYRDVEEKYGDLGDVKADMTEMMRYFKYHFPEEKVPTVVTFVAPFRYANVYYYDTIGVGLDMYMGPDYEFYPTVQGLPGYKIRKMDKQYILPGLAKALVNMKFPEPRSQGRFLDVIIYEGKVLYCLDAFLPNTADTLKVGYTGDQLQWCYDNKSSIWAHMIETELLYSTDVKHYIRYLNDGPFTTAPGVPPESAPMIGIWTGWQIVREFMKNNSQITLKELMEINDAELILKKSGYKP